MCGMQQSLVLFLLFENAIHSGDFWFSIIRTDLSSCLTMREKKNYLLPHPLSLKKRLDPIPHIYIFHISAHIHICFCVKFVIRARVGCQTGLGE